MSRVIEIRSYSDQESFIRNNPSGVIFFGSYRCPHCQDMVPVFEDLTRQYPNVGFAHVEITKVEVENVNGVPVFVGYRNKVPIDIVLGADEDKLFDMINNQLLY